MRTLKNYLLLGVVLFLLSNGKTHAQFTAATIPENPFVGSPTWIGRGIGNDVLAKGGDVWEVTV